MHLLNNSYIVLCISYSTSLSVFLYSLFNTVDVLYVGFLYAIVIVQHVAHMPSA